MFTIKLNRFEPVFGYSVGIHFKTNKTKVMFIQPYGSIKELTQLFLNDMSHQKE